MAHTRLSQNKTAAKQNNIQEVLADKLPSASKTFFGELSQGLCTDWLVCIAYFILWYLIGSDQLSYFS